MESTARLLTHKIAIAIVEDDAIAREALAALLPQQSDFAVVAAVADFRSPLPGDVVAEVILMDSRLTDWSDPQTLQALAETARRSRVIATRVSKGDRHIAELIRVGVFGFVLKEATFAELLATIRTVAEGTQVTPPCLLEALVRDLVHEGDRRAATTASRFDQMTAQEAEIVMLIANGKSNKEIAAQRCISPHTAKTHVRNIMEKLSVHSRLQIAAQANQERWRLRPVPLDARRTRTASRVSAMSPSASY